MGGEAHHAMTLDELRAKCDRAEALGQHWLSLSIGPNAGRFPLLGGGTQLVCINRQGTRTYHVRVNRVRRFLERIATPVT